MAASEAATWAALAAAMASITWGTSQGGLGEGSVVSGARAPGGASGGVGGRATTARMMQRAISAAMAALACGIRMREIKG